MNNGNLELTEGMMQIAETFKVFVDFASSVRTHAEEAGYSPTIAEQMAFAAYAQMLSMIPTPVVLDD